MELVTGVEPATYGLQNRCSAIELHQPNAPYCRRAAARFQDEKSADPAAIDLHFDFALDALERIIDRFGVAPQPFGYLLI